MIVYALQLTGPFNSGPEELFSEKGRIVPYLMEKYGNCRLTKEGNLLVQKKNSSGQWQHCYQVSEIEVL